MSSRDQVTLPPIDDIVAAILRAESFEAACNELGVSANTLRNRMRRDPDGLGKTIMDARREAGKGKLQPKDNVDFGEDVSQLELLKARNAELEKFARSSRKADIEEEAWIRRIEAVTPTITPKYKPLLSRKKQMEAHEMVVLFSDTHAGEVVSRDETLGMNEYDWRVMLRRMARLQEAVLSYQSHRPYPITKLHVWFLGDMLSGSIHEELANTNEMADADAVVQFARDSAEWLEGFVPHFPGPISVCGVPGNHPRRSKKPSAKRAGNNDDRLAYEMVRLYHRENPAFEWNFPSANFATTTVARHWRVLLMHGDGIRSTMPGVPWGGVVRRITTLEQQFQKAKQPLDLVCLGHFHQAAALEGVGTKTILNGSVKGLDEYSLKQFGSGRPPAQVLLTFHPARGLTDVSYIDLEPVVPASGLRAVA